MTILETSQGFVNVGAYRVNVTARLDTANREHMTAIVEKTVKLWLFVAKAITANQRKAEWPEGVALTPEDIVKPNHFTPIAEPRCTVWGDIAGSGFTVHSYSNAQDALDIFYSRMDGLKIFAIAPEAPKAPATPQGSQTPENAPRPANSPSDAISSPSVDGVTKISGKKTAATLPNGSLFELPIYQIKLQSKNDVRYYEVFTKYGSKLGDWPELTIYSDNEIAKTNGVLDFLGGFDLTPGKDKMGEWVLRGVVKDKGDKKNLYAVSIRSAA